MLSSIPARSVLGGHACLCVCVRRESGKASLLTWISTVTTEYFRTAPATQFLKYSNDQHLNNDTGKRRVKSLSDDWLGGNKDTHDDMKGIKSPSRHCMQARRSKFGPSATRLGLVDMYHAVD